MAEMPNSSGKVPTAIAGLADHVCRYFLEFLETDFKRQQAPRRKITSRSDNGQLTCISLRKYNSFYKEVWKVASQPVGKGLVLAVKRQQHTARLNPILANLIKQHVAAIEDKSFMDAVKATLEQAKRGRGTGTNQVERYVDGVLEALGESLDKKVIMPLLALMESTIKQQAYSAIDSVYELETDLVNALIAQASAALPDALTAYLVNGDLAPVEKILKDLVEPQESRQRLQDSLAEFTTADLYQELRDLYDYQRTQEAGQLYLYLCDLKFRNNLYPLLYVPMSFDWDKDKGEFRLSLDPHLFVNKRALDFVLQELDRQQDRRALSPIDDRIHYLREDGTLLEEISKVVNKVQSRLDLDRQIDVRTGTLQGGANATVKLTSACFLASFDKSDESVLNDYEDLLHALSGDKEGLLSLFQSFVKGVVLDNPVQVIRQVDDAWDALSIPERLVPESPIPINEEQRKLLVALERDDCRFLVALGPPGTGKSHTITAIAFDCILKGKNVLILSDKKEALDVVEDKLTNSLKAVRGDDNFLNPLLRLGRTGQTYTKLLSQNATEKIRQHNRAARQHNKALQEELQSNQLSLKQGISKTVEELSGVDLKEIEELHTIETILNGRLPGLAEFMQRAANPSDVKDLLACLDAALASPSLPQAAKLVREQPADTPFHEIIVRLKRRAALSFFNIDSVKADLNKLELFHHLKLSDKGILDRYLNDYIQLKNPLFGYLFKGSKISALNHRVAQALSCADAQNLHQRMEDVRFVSKVLGLLDKAFEKLGLPPSDAPAIYDELSRGRLPEANPLDVIVALGKTYSNIGSACPEGLKLQEFSGIEDLLTVMRSAARYGVIWHDINARMEALPSLDAVNARSVLEKLQTQRMAEQMDNRFLNFIDTAHATAKALGGVIRSKQKFPTDSFDHLRNAFPCIIAGIREFAEYIPLRQDIFDVVIIDEASQVSVAQAFPALLRAKKVVVMGDPKQFSNVKSANASNEVNQAWRSDMETYFRAHISDKADKLERLSRFDVKRSILDFFDLVANFRIMLRKHFRGYQELISFSSRYFYGNGLQAIKVRGKPLDEVIAFTELTWDGRQESYRNVNSMEMQALLEYLDDHLEEPVPPSVGIITPFREQQSLLTRELFKAKNAQRYEDELHLKIMTFDTCQGEERDIIYYSMVATPQNDRLNYIFPVDLENASDRVDEALKMQRLNVGFSRAKEAMHFIVSKPIDQYRGSIARALQHYAGVLEAGDPDPESVDPASPMEAKVLDWLLKTQFVQANHENIEITPQFPVGDYLKQLDPFYQHPAYRVDFLLQYCASAGNVNIIIEYDGFQEHFTEHGKIHEGNFSRYYRPEDVERQMVLESYGYKFLRINRFNLGRDPVLILSKRLYDLVGAANKGQVVETVDKIQAQAKSLADGTSKVCQRCTQIKPLKDFFDKTLKGGDGGYGRVCMACKNSGRSSSYGGGSTRYRRWRRRYY